MDTAIAVATVVKKMLELLATNKKGRSFLGYVLGIAIVLLLLPVLVIYGLFGWMSDDGATLALRDKLLDNLPMEDAVMLEKIETTCDTIQSVFEVKGLSVTDERKAEAIYLTCLVGREDEDDFYNALADCFLYADGDTTVYDWVEGTFGVTISEDNREAIEKIE